jgi:hypothetical protein
MPTWYNKQQTDTLLATKATPAQVATAVTNAVNGLLNGAPGALDTLKELADAIGDDANYAASVTAALAARALALNITGTKTAAYTAGLNELIPVDATSAGVTITLPTVPTAGTRVTVKKTDATTNTVTVARGGSTDVFNKTGGSTTLTLTLQNQSATIQYAGGVWYVSGGDLPLSSLQTSLSATYLTLKQAAKDPDLLIVGALTRDSAGRVTSAAVAWPDGTAGTYTALNFDPSGATNSYSITYGSPASKTYTQPAITRDATGAAITIPPIGVS